MSGLGPNGIIQKERTESILQKITSKTSYTFTSNVKNTPVANGNAKILNIYYRDNAIRINIYPESI